MMILRFAALWIAVFGFTLMGCGPAHAEQASSAPPSFSEVYSLVRSNMAGATEADLNRAAVAGLLSQLQGRATLVTNTAVAGDGMDIPLVSKSTVFDKAYGFVRVGRVGSGLAKEVEAAYKKLVSTNSLEGLVVDLRYALGQDYRAAAETADLFINKDQPLLDLGGVTLRSSAKSAAIEVPIVILVNGETSGAAEALAAAMRQADGALIIGSPTAGRAFLFREFTLSSGQKLRLATGRIAVGTGKILPETGITPDIAISVNPENEKAYFEDPYKVFSKPFAGTARPATNNLALLQSTNRSRRRLNEAELVRMQREGLDFESEQVVIGPPQPTGPVINDPALARALDLLKGVALALKRH